MKLTLSVLCGSMLLLGGLPLTLAADMNCGDNIIEGDQINGMSKEQIRKYCGDPDGESGGDWFYNKDGTNYHLHFNGDDQLDSISEDE